MLATVLQLNPALGITTKCGYLENTESYFGSSAYICSYLDHFSAVAAEFKVKKGIRLYL